MSSRHSNTESQHSRAELEFVQGGGYQELWDASNLAFSNPEICFSKFAEQV